MFTPQDFLQHLVLLQRFALKPKPRNFLKVLQSNTFKKSLSLGLSAKRHLFESAI